MRIAVLAALVLALPAAACGGGSATGLWGTVTRGPTKPVCSEAGPCTEPAVGSTLVLSRRGRAVARVRVGERGRYTVSLRAGDYRVRTPAGFMSVEPVLVHVVAGKRRHVDFAIDTGIR
jgi:hypothetical protein